MDLPTDLSTEIVDILPIAATLPKPTLTNGQLLNRPFAIQAGYFDPMNNCILEIALPVPLTQYFDYKFVGNDSEIPKVGQRIQVPFGRASSHSKAGARKLIGIITAIKTESEIDDAKLKHALAILDDEPLLSPKLVELLKWSAQYYHYPPGAVFEAALPVWLRKKIELPEKLQEQVWRLTEKGHIQHEAERFAKLKKRAPVQAALLDHLAHHPEGLSSADLNKDVPKWRNSMRALEKKQLAYSELSELLIQLPMHDVAPQLSDEQKTAVAAIDVALAKKAFAPFLLQGVTGSGKTECYLAAAEHCLRQGKQVLCLVPEIALTPQFIERFEQRLQTPLAVLHSGINDRARCLAWMAAQDGTAKVILGTRSALFTPMQDPGLIIVDEEHDSSFKQQDGFRYSARDLALVRAKNENITIILGSATPGIESLYQAQQGHYQHLQLLQRPDDRPMPVVHLIDMKKEPGQQGLSYPLIANMEKVLARDEQVLVFLNRRGFSPVLLCPECMWSGVCNRCEVNMTYHQAKNRLRCHHCNKDQVAPKHCPSCKNELKPVGQGTERVEEFLRTRFPDTPVIRIDRDTTRSKEQMRSQLAAVHSGGAKILVGTQMLTKGHDFPNVTLVGVLDADGGLFSSDFRASERLAQQIVQVSGRAGRAEKPGLVLIQTMFTDHPLLNQLTGHAYMEVAQDILQQRESAEWPPYSHLALIRAESAVIQEPMVFLRELKKHLEAVLDEKLSKQVQLLGPAYAPMAKRAGYFRTQLLFQSPTRASLHQVLHHTQEIIHKMKLSRHIRWSLDVDPVELY